MDKTSKIIENPSAFPFERIMNGTTQEWSRGMTLRDYFAAVAMQAAVTAMNMKEKYDTPNEVLEVLDLIPKNAYWIADKMLEERQK